MEIQFKGKDGKILYCNDDYLRITMGGKHFQRGVSEIGKARVFGDTVVFVDNFGVHIADVMFKPEQEARVSKVVERVNAQNKDVSVPDSIYDKIKAYRNTQFVKLVLMALLSIAVAIFTVREMTPTRRYERDISHNTKLLVNQYDQLMDELEKANTFNFDWAYNAAVEIEDIRIFVSECQKIKVPEKFSSEHKVYLTFLEEFKKGADALEMGLEKGEPKYGVTARGHFDKGLESLRQYTAMTSIVID